MDGEHRYQHHQRAADERLGEYQDRGPARGCHPREFRDARGHIPDRVNRAAGGGRRRARDGEPEQRQHRGAEGSGGQRDRGRRGGHGEQHAGQQRPDQRTRVLHHRSDRVAGGELGRRADQPGQDRGLQRSVGPRQRRARGSHRDHRDRRVAQRGHQRRGRQQHRPHAGDPAQQAIAPQPAGDTGQDQRHHHARQGPGHGIRGNQRGTARAERVHDQRDRARQLAQSPTCHSRARSAGYPAAGAQHGPFPAALPSRWLPHVPVAAAAVSVRLCGNPHTC